MARYTGYEGENMKRNTVITCVFVLCVAVSVAFVPFLTYTMHPLHIVKNASYFSDYYVDSDKVYTKCVVTVRNSGPGRMEFLLYADMDKDARSGLLKNGNLEGYNEALSNERFVLEGKTTETFSVIFVGDYAGSNTKHDRYMPRISFMILE